jgi:hypothetical protein
VCAVYKSVDPKLLSGGMGLFTVAKRRNFSKNLPKKRFDFAAPNSRPLFGFFIW